MTIDGTKLDVPGVWHDDCLRHQPAGEPGSGDEAWLDVVTQLCARAREAGADAIVLSHGVDAPAADPESPLQVTADGYRAAGAFIDQLGPVAVIQEGGYDLASLGKYVLAALSGLHSASE